MNLAKQIIKNKSKKEYILFLIALLPPIILGFLIWRYSVNIPFWDQWDTPGTLIYEATQNKLTWEQWMRQHNESRTLFPNLLFLTLANLSNWNTRYEMVVTFILACLVAVNIYYLSKKNFGRSWQHLICFLLASLLIFSPLQYENWMWGFQGITFTSIAAITTSFVAIFSQTNWVYKIIISFIASTVATFSFANGFLCWIIISLALLYKSIRDRIPKKALVFCWLVLLGAVTSIYFYDYNSLSEQSALTQILGQPGLAFQYYTSVIGASIFLANHSISPIAGTIVLFLAIVISFYLYQNRDDLLLIDLSLPWLLIGLYALLSIALITMGRMRLGLQSAFAPRYTTFSTYLLIALIYLIALILVRLESKKIIKIIAICSLGLSIAIQQHNFVLGASLIADSSYQRLYGKTCVITLNLIQDIDCVAEKIYPNLDLMEDKANQFDLIGFLNPGLLDRINWQTKARSKNSKILNGKIEQNYFDDNNLYVISGWVRAFDRQPSFDSVILTYQTRDRDPKAWAIAPLTTNQSNIWQLSIAPQSLKLTWSKTFELTELPPANSKISAWAFDTNNAKAYPLEGDYFFSLDLLGSYSRF